MLNFMLLNTQAPCKWIDFLTPHSFADSGNVFHSVMLQ